MQSQPNKLKTDQVDSADARFAPNKSNPSLEVDRLLGTDLLDRYHIESIIGEGGWGRVYKGRHLALGTPVAIKVLKRHLIEDQSRLNRFYQEARATCDLRHENIASVYDFGTGPADQPFMVMDYLSGKSLEEQLHESKSLTPQLAVPLFIQIAAGLQAAHRKGIVHRDIKPGNIFLVNENGKETVKILDFGLSVAINPDGTPMHHFTRTGETVGTPAYMSPEQCRGANIDEQSDIYSLGCVMYETLTGVQPFEAPSLFEIMSLHMNTIPPSFREAIPHRRIGHRLEAIVFTALEKDKSARYRDVTALLQDLQDYSQNANAGTPVSNALSPRNRQQIKKGLERLRHNMPFTLAICILVGILLAAISWLSMRIAGTSQQSKTTTGTEYVYRPPSGSCVTYVDCSQCPQAFEFGKQAAKVIDTNYPRIKEMFGIPEGTPKPAVGVIFVSDTTTPPGMTGGGTMVFNANIAKPGNMGVVAWQFAIVVEHFVPPQAGCTSPAWIRAALADVCRARAVGVEGDTWCAHCSPGVSPTTTSSCGAAFLMYVEKAYPQADIIKSLYKALRVGLFKKSLWLKTGHSVEDLWAEYQKSDQFHRDIELAQTKKLFKP